MALRKQKQYDWKDSNLALFGSDVERSVKKESAQQEPAWRKAGQKVGLQIWRIVKFKVVAWPVEDYGKFFNGDSYIVLNTYTREGGDELLYDVHFWIGKYSSQDEYGTAAYKTVELDTYLDDAPIQHREVQGYESELFKNYFKEITLLEGGAESGFRHVKPEEYKPRLFHFHGDRKRVEVKEVLRNRSKLDSTDVYILDMGLQLYQWNGEGSNKDERMKAMQYLIGLKGERGGKSQSETLDQGCTEETHEFYCNLNEDVVEDDDMGSDYEPSAADKELYRLSDATGKMNFSLEKKGNMAHSDLDSSDVFILDTHKELYVWIGKGTTTAEKKNALTYAHNYLMKTTHPYIPISCLPEGYRSDSFNAAIAA